MGMFLGGILVQARLKYLMIPILSIPLGIQIGIQMCGNFFGIFLLPPNTIFYLHKISLSPNPIPSHPFSLNLPAESPSIIQVLNPTKTSLENLLPVDSNQPNPSTNSPRLQPINSHPFFSNPFNLIVSNEPGQVSPTLQSPKNPFLSFHKIIRKLMYIQLKYSQNVCE